MFQLGSIDAWRTWRRTSGGELCLRLPMGAAFGGTKSCIWLAWADIDFESQQIRIASKRAGAQTIAWEPKDHEKRFVPMSEEAAQLLARMQIEGEDNHPYVFISPRRLATIMQRQSAGRWSSRSEVINNMWVRLDRMVVKASLSKLSLHDLTRILHDGWDVGVNWRWGLLWDALDACGAENPLSPMSVTGCQGIQVGRRWGSLRWRTTRSKRTFRG